MNIIATKFMFKIPCGNNIAVAFTVFGVICLAIWFLRTRYPQLNEKIKKILKWRPGKK